VSYYGDLWRESFHVFGFAREITLGDEQREIGILVSGFLEHLVERPLHLLPDGIPVGTDHHAAADRAVIGQLGTSDDLVVPGAEVRSAGGQALGISHGAAPGSIGQTTGARPPPGYQSGDL
jgi:hypothetical protein